MMRCSQSRLKEPYSSNNVRENIVKTKKISKTPESKENMDGQQSDDEQDQTVKSESNKNADSEQSDKIL